MRYHFKVHKEGKGYWAECVELDGCRTQGSTLSELRENMKEALDLYLSEPADSKEIFPPPKKKPRGANIEPVKVSAQVAFAMSLRQARVARKITQKKAATLLGFNNVWSYQKLETKTANPRIDTIDKVKEVFPELEIDSLVG